MNGVAKIDRPVIVLGAGGHAKVVISVLRCVGAEIMGAVDSNSARLGSAVLGVPVIGNDGTVAAKRTDEVILANGVGSIRRPEARARLFDRFAESGFRFATLIHPSAILAEGVTVGEGTQIMAGCIVQPDAVIGRNAIVNTGASVDHDSVVGDHVHIAPGAVLSGGVTVGASSHIGAGATIVQGITIGRDCLVRAGALVVNDLSDGESVAGVPARIDKEAR